MATLHQFKTYLKQRTSGEMIPLLLNYIHCFYPLTGQDFKAQIIENFYLSLLHSLHYRSIHTSASHTLLDEIQPFFRKHLIEAEFMEIKAILPPQIVPIEKSQDRLSALEIWHKKHNSPQDSIHVMPIHNEDSMLVLALKPDGRLRIFVHGPAFILRQGELTPLSPLSRLLYNRQFELEHSKNQIIFYPPDRFCCFEIHSFRTECRTYNIKDFSKIKSMAVKNIKDDEDLFFHIKKIEHYYIKPKSDSFYKDLIQSLQSCYQLLIANHPQAVDSAKKHIPSARRALRDFYPGDRLLLLLIANIEFRLKLKPDIAFDILTGHPSKDPFIRSAILNDPS